MLNISRARVYDTTQWASSMSADLLMETIRKIGQLYFYAYVCLQEYESVFLMIAKIFL